MIFFIVIVIICAISFGVDLAELEKACNLGEGNACGSLGVMYEDGAGVQKDINKAKFYYQKACKRGDEASCESLKQLD